MWYLYGNICNKKRKRNFFSECSIDQIDVKLKKLKREDHTQVFFKIRNKSENI